MEPQEKYRFQIYQMYISEQVKRIRAMHWDLISREFKAIPVVDYLRPYAENLWKHCQEGNRMVLVELNNYHRDWLGFPRDEIVLSQLNLEDFLETTANEFGFSSWKWLEDHLEVKMDPEFERAVDYLLLGKLDLLQKVIDNHPELLTRSSVYGHQAGLIHYVASNGVEIWRQVVPSNLLEITQYLLEKGASINQSHNIYGGNCSLIDLIASSAHPKDAGLSESLIDLINAYQP